MVYSGNILSSFEFHANHNRQGSPGIANHNFGEVLSFFQLDAAMARNGIAGIGRSQPVFLVRLIKDGISCAKKQRSKLYKGTCHISITDITCLQHPFKVSVCRTSWGRCSS